MRVGIKSLVLVFAMTSMSLGCDDGGTTEQPVPEGCDLFVVPSSDDQTQVQTALLTVGEGQVLCLGAGTYSFVSELSLAIDGVIVRGDSMETTIFDFSNQDSGGNGFAITSDGVTVEDFTVLNTPGDGIRATDVTGITFRRVAARWDHPDVSTHGAYGLYPVGCTNVLIENCVADGARDAGIYVGQSTNIIIRDSEAYNNVAGIEVENSIDAEVYGCHAYDNTAGLAIFDLPGLAQYGSRTNAHDNILENNNVPNFGEPGSAVASIPAGIGMFILASDLNEVHNNIIRGNQSAGAAIVAHDPLFGASDDPNFDSFPSGNYIHDNMFENNGAMPMGVAISLIDEMYRPVDIFWDGCIPPAEEMAPSNCLNNNGDATFYSRGLCPGSMMTTDIASITCEGETLPAVMLPAS